MYNILQIQLSNGDILLTLHLIFFNDTSSNNCNCHKAATWKLQAVSKNSSCDRNVEIVDFPFASIHSIGVLRGGAKGPWLPLKLVKV